MTDDPEISFMDGPYWILTRALARFVDPFRDDVWNTGVILRRDVAACLTANRFELRQNELVHRDDGYDDTARIAYLVKHRSSVPISIDVLDDDVRIDDGCHRLGAAIYRRDRFVLVEYGGDVNRFHRLFRTKFLVSRPVSE